MFQGYVKLPDGIVALYIKWWLIVKNMESNCFNPDGWPIQFDDLYIYFLIVIFHSEVLNYYRG